MSEKTIRDVWDSPDRKYPSVVYVETTNFCNANCKSCLNDRTERIRGVMSLDTFKTIADKVKSNGSIIGAMFCFGEPLIDNTLFEKFEYAKNIDVLAPHVGFNTNCSFLTEEKYEKICKHTPNITLSFFNTGKKYEELTGGLSWDVSYKNAIEFIKYRDAHFAGYPIFIGVNKVAGHNLEKVEEAFIGRNVTFVQDAELRWGGKVITGVIDRMIMYHDWRCDGYKGALQIKYDGSCEFCAYDIIGSKDGGETKFSNILTDSWEEIQTKFKEKFQSGCSLCKRCDFWYNSKAVMENNFSKPFPVPEDWNDWQKPYIGSGEKFCD